MNQSLRMGIKIFWMVFLSALLLLVLFLPLLYYIEPPLFHTSLVIMLIIAVSLSLLSSLVVSHWLRGRFLRPLSHLRKILSKAKKATNAPNAAQKSLKHHSKLDEINSIKMSVNQLLKQLNDSNKTITSYEAILELGVKERNKITHQITHFNIMTGLPNRNSIKEYLTDLIAKEKPSQKEMVILILELRDYQEITHAFDHRLGQLWIQEVAKMLSAHLPASTFIAHLTSSRFGIVQQGLDEPEQIITLAQWLLDLFNQPFTIAEEKLLTTVNLGISIYPQDGDDPESLLINANLALNRAKSENPNSYQFYEKEMNQNVTFKRNLLIDLHDAVKKNQFVVYFQPFVELKSHKLVGNEALMRWQHPEQGLISPAQFISLAEESGLMIRMGEWILREACKQTKAWQDQGFSNLFVAVNLSPIQFKQKNLISIVSDILTETALPPECLELEITESSVMSNIEQAITTMKALHALGINLSLDDFGTGYSSLSYLKKFPIQKLKIDQSFVRDLGMINNHKPLADIIILLSHSLNLKVIAEGVETITQLNYLQEKNCDEAQGYYFGKPMPAELW